MKTLVKIFCKTKSTKQNGEAPIYFLLRSGKKETLINSTKYIPPKYFDNVKEKVKAGYGNAMQLNKYLSEEVEKLEAIILELQKRGAGYTHKSIVDAYLNKGSDKFIPFARAELKKERKAFKTIEQHTGSLKNLEKYSPEVTFAQLTPAFMRDYESYLIDQGRQQNGYMHDFVTIRKYVLLAKDAGLMKESPFGSRNGKFKIHYKDTTPEFLYEEEVDKLFALLDSGNLSPKLHHSLLYFLIGIETGLRYGDVVQIATRMFRGSVLQDDTMKEGEPYLRENCLFIILNKNKHRDSSYHRMPLTKRALSLIETKVDKEILSNKYINEDIRTVGRMKDVGINRHFTFHCSRHTFGTQGTTDGLAPASIQKLLGHSTPQMTKKYAKIIDPVLDMEIQKKDKTPKNPENEALIKAFKAAIETNPDFKDQLSKLLLPQN